MVDDTNENAIPELQRFDTAEESSKARKLFPGWLGETFDEISDTAPTRMRSSAWETALNNQRSREESRNNTAQREISDRSSSRRWRSRARQNRSSSTLSNDGATDPDRDVSSRGRPSRLSTGGAAPAAAEASVAKLHPAPAERLQSFHSNDENPFVDALSCKKPPVKEEAKPARRKLRPAAFRRRRASGLGGRLPQQVAEEAEVVDGTEVGNEPQVLRRVSFLMRRTSSLRSLRRSSVSQPPPPVPELARRASLGEEWSSGVSNKIIPAPFGYIHPQSRFKMAWDGLVMVFILYSTVTVPVFLAFDVEDEGFFAVFEWFVDALFVTDILITFRTGIANDLAVDDPLIDYNPCTIARAYFRSWFFLDVAASVPLDKLFPTKQLSLLPILKAIRLMRLIRLVRLIKLSRFVKRIDEEGIISPTIVRLSSLLFTLIFFTHLLACAFYAVGSYIRFGDELTWVDHYKVKYARYEWASVGILDDDTFLRNKYESLSEENRSTIASALRTFSVPLARESTAQRWLTSFYWALTTMSTVGYGDIYPVSHQERLFVLLAEVFGVIFFGYITSSIRHLTRVSNRKETSIGQTLEMVNAYLMERRVPNVLRRRSHDFFEYYYARKKMVAMPSLLNELTSSLRYEVTIHEFADYLEVFPTLRSQNTDFLAAFCSALEPFFSPAHEYIVFANVLSTEMFFITHGLVGLFSSDESSKLGTLCDGGCFGLQALKSGGAYCADYSARALVLSHLLYLSKSSFDEICVRFPDAFQIVSRMLGADYIDAMRTCGQPNRKLCNREDSASTRTSSSTIDLSGLGKGERVNSLMSEVSTPGKAERSVSEMSATSIREKLEQSVSRMSNLSTPEKAERSGSGISEPSASGKAEPSISKNAELLTASTAGPSVAAAVAVSDTRNAICDPPPSPPSRDPRSKEEAFASGKFGSGRMGSSSRLSVMAPSAPPIPTGYCERRRPLCEQTEAFDKQLESALTVRRRAGSISDQEAACESATFRGIKRRLEWSKRCKKPSNTTLACGGEESSLFRKKREARQASVCGEEAASKTKAADANSACQPRSARSEKSALSGSSRQSTFGKSISRLVSFFRKHQKGKGTGGQAGEISRMSRRVPGLRIMKVRLDAGPMMPTDRAMRAHSENAAAYAVKHGTVYEFHEHDVRKKRFIIRPSNPWKIRWDMLIGLLTLYSCSALPYRFGFSDEASCTPPASGVSCTFFVFDSSVDFLFIIDIFLSFFSATRLPTGELTTDLRHIATSYLSGFFVVDLLSSFPVNLVFLLAVPDFNANALQLIRLIRLVRLLRLLRLLKVKNYFKRIQNELNLNKATTQLFELLLYILYSLHCAGCLWYLIISLDVLYTKLPTEGDSKQLSWAASTEFLELDCKELGYCEPDRVWASRYLASAYWAFTTLSTIGFGDITANSDVEKVMACILMLIGPIMLGYILSRITDLVASIDVKSSRRRARMASLKVAFREAMLPKELQTRMLDYYSSFLSEGSDYTAEQAMLLRLPPPLKLELVLFLSKEMILKISLFDGQEPAFIVSVCKTLVPVFAAPGDYLFREGAVAKEMFFLQVVRHSLIQLALEASYKACLSL